MVLEGRIDQINPLPDHAVELVDYKTGRPPSQKDADKSLQLSVYALAARDQMQLNPTRLTFYSLTNNEPVCSVRTPKDLDVVIREIREVAAQIRQQLFPPKTRLCVQVLRLRDDLPGARRDLLAEFQVLSVLGKPR